MSDIINTDVIEQNNDVVGNNSVEVNEENITSKGKSKKIIIISIASALTVVIAVVVVLLFVLNAKSEEAIRVDDIISGIGVVTIDSDAKITSAENEVKALSEDDYAQLDNLKILEDARKEYNRIINRQQADSVIAIIKQIREVSSEDIDTINNARNKYELLTEDGKEMVTNYNELVEAEKAIEKITKERIDNVIKLIDDIGKVTANSEKKINTAKEAYKKLETTEQAQVTNYSKLTEAESEFSKINKQNLKEKIKKALSKLNKNYDDVTGVTWYEATTKPKYADTRTFVLPYIGIEEGNEAWLCLKANYTGDDWIFFDNLIIRADDKSFERNCPYFDINRDNDSGVVWEEYNKGANSSDIDWLKAVANSDNATIRFSGTYMYDFNVPESDKQAIKNVIEAYDLILEYTLYDYNEVMNN